MRLKETGKGEMGKGKGSALSWNVTQFSGDVLRGVSR